MRKLTKKLNNNTFSGGNDVNGMDGGGGPRWGSFKAKMGKARKSIKSKIITGARGIRTGSQSVGKGFKWLGRSLKSGLSKVRQTLHRPFKNQSLAKIGSRVEKRTKKLEAKTSSYKTKITNMDTKRQKYTNSIKTFEEMLKIDPKNPYAERRLRETSDKLKKLATLQNQITEKLTTRKAELNTSKGKLNNYTKNLEAKAIKKTNKAMSNYEKFHTKDSWKRNFLKFATRAGRRSRAINKSLKKRKDMTGDQMILQYQKYKIAKNGVKGSDGKFTTPANPQAKMNSQQTIREILAERKAKQFNLIGRREKKDLVSYLKTGKNTKLEERVIKAKEGANTLIKNFKLRSNINKNYSEKARLLSKQRKNTETRNKLEKTNKTADEKRKIKRAYNRDIKRGNSNKIYNLEKNLFKNSRNKALEKELIKNPNLNQEKFKEDYHTKEAKKIFSKDDYIENRNDYKMAKKYNLISNTSKRKEFIDLLKQTTGPNRWNTTKFKRYKELKNKSDKSNEEIQQFKELEEERSKFKSDLKIRILRNEKNRFFRDLPKKTQEKLNEITRLEQSLKNKTPEEQANIETKIKDLIAQISIDNLTPLQQR